MKHLTRLMLVTALAALAACAHHPDGKPAVCDGRHRRPANPYGSVLPNLPGAAIAPATSRAAPPPAPPAVPIPLSAADPRLARDLRSYAPCGDRT